jgi:hypothetical protein
MPLDELAPIPLKKLKGTDKCKAHGQEIIRKIMPLKRLSSKVTSGKKSINAVDSSKAAKITIGV